MAHKIFGQRFLSRSEPAWHGLGLVFPADEEVLPSAAVERVAGDLRFETRKLFYLYDGVAHDTDSQAILRLPTKEDPKPMVMGVSSEKWRCEPYVQLARALDRIDPKTYKVETCGLLSGGALLFVALRGEDWAVLGKDEMRSYFVVNLSQQVGVAHRVMHVDVRVVCNNTNEAAIASSKIDLRIPHGADVAQQVGLAGDLLVRFRKAQQETQRIFDVFASTPAPQKAVHQIINAAFPEPKLPSQLRLLRGVVGEEGAQTFMRSLDPAALQSLLTSQERHEKALERVEQLRVAGWDRFHAFEPSDLRGTVWAAYNAVTELADWRGDGRDVGESTLVGSRAAEKARAFGAAAAVCGIN